MSDHKMQSSRYLVPVNMFLNLNLCKHGTSELTVRGNHAKTVTTRRKITCSNAYCSIIEELANNI